MRKTHSLQQTGQMGRQRLGRDLIVEILKHRPDSSVLRVQALRIRSFKEPRPAAVKTLFNHSFFLIISSIVVNAQTTSAFLCPAVDEKNSCLVTIACVSS